MKDIYSITLIAVPGIPLIQESDDVGAIIIRCAKDADITFEEKDVLVVAQKIISKAEGAVVDLNSIVPSHRAHELALVTGRDPRLCQVYLDESQEILGVHGGRVIVRHRLGFVCSSAGVDKGNVALPAQLLVSLLPRDPDQSARELRDQIFQLAGTRVAVIISDSFGRPDREGSVGIAIGVAGISPIKARIKPDLFGLVSTRKIAIVDELSAAASVLMDQNNEGRPVILIRGVDYDVSEETHIGELLSG